MSSKDKKPIEREILGVVWYAGRSCIGIIRIRYWGGEPEYKIGVSEREWDESRAIKSIADWGASFPPEAGDVLFSVGKVQVMR
jgi:hypothetical protein